MACCSASLGTAVVVGASVGGICDALGIPSVAFIPVVIVGILALRQVIRYVPESRAPKAFRRTSAVVNFLLLVVVFVLVYLVIVAREFLDQLAAGAPGRRRIAVVRGVCALAQATRPILPRR